MPKYDYQSLKALEDKRVQMVSTDGEIIKAVVYYVYEEEQDLAYDILSTNRPERYAGGKPGTTYVIPFEHIAAIEEVREPPGA